MRNKVIILMMGILGACGTANARESSLGTIAHSNTKMGAAFNWVINAGIGFGKNTELDEMSPGGGLIVGLGADYQLNDLPMAVRSTVNYQFDTNYSNYKDEYFSRVGIDLLGYYIRGNQRVGLGLTHHFSPDYKEVSTNGPVKASFKNALGFLAEYNYVFENDNSIAIRYTYINYKVNHVSANATVFDGVNLDGSFLSISYNFLI